MHGKHFNQANGNTRSFLLIVLEMIYASYSPAAHHTTPLSSYSPPLYIPPRLCPSCLQIRWRSSSLRAYRHITISTARLIPRTLARRVRRVSSMTRCREVGSCILLLLLQMLLMMRRRSKVGPGVRWRLRTRMSSSSGCGVHFNHAGLLRRKMHRGCRSGLLQVPKLDILPSVAGVFDLGLTCLLPGRHVR